ALDAFSALVGERDRTSGGAPRRGAAPMKFLYDAQIESQPDAVVAVFRRPAPRLDPSRPLLFCGQGTSLHAARIAAAWAGYPAQALDSHDVALRSGIPSGAQVVAISHSGRGFTAAVLRKARAAGASTFAVCGDAATADADHVVRTCAPELAQTHSVSYVTALAALGQMLGLDLSSARRLRAARRGSRRHPDSGFQRSAPPVRLHRPRPAPRGGDFPPDRRRSRPLTTSGVGHGFANRSTAAARISVARASSATGTNSPLRCATRMSPGPNTQALAPSRTR